MIDSADNRIGPRKLDFFTYSNIRGRSGRMLRQFVGKVIVYGEAPQRESRTVDVPAYSQDKAPLCLSSCRGTSSPQHRVGAPSPATSSSSST